MDSAFTSEGHDASTGEAIRTKPQLTFLRQLLGDTWVDTNVFGKKPKHLLGQWWKKGDHNPWVAYTEHW